MKKLKIIRTATIYFIMWIFVLHASACSNSINQGKQERNLDSFNELNLSISADVILVQGSKQKVEIQASDKLLNLIETDVKAGVLTIKWSKWNVNYNEKIKIYITMVDIKALRISGSGDIIAEGKISGNSIDLAVSGSGDIKLSELAANDIKSKISGSADIVIGGNNTANTLEASISGSGNIDAANLSVKNVEITVSGSGDFRVNALETIKARISGSGDVYYKGSATVDARVSGSGSVQHIN